MVSENPISCNIIILYRFHFVLMRKICKHLLKIVNVFDVIVDY